MHHYCTLFDRNYLYKGMLLYQSLLRHSTTDFCLWILCMDDIAYEFLKKLELKNVKLVTLAEYENEQLLKVKKERTVAEYSWTGSANFCWHMLNRLPEGEMITYLDADMYFFSDPEVIFQEIGNASIAIVGHKFQGIRKKFEKYTGVYNVAWVSFKKDAEGTKACEWWKDRVLERCSADLKGGNIGDQHYLNDWPERFKNVHVIQHTGADIAPWNVNNYKFSLREDKVYVDAQPLVFYHFHNFALIKKDFYLTCSNTYIPSDAKKYVYSEYRHEMKKIIQFVQERDPAFVNYGFKKKYFNSMIGQVIFNLKFVDSFYVKHSIRKLEKSY